MTALWTLLGLAFLAVAGLLSIKIEGGWGRVWNQGKAWGGGYDPETRTWDDVGSIRHSWVRMAHLGPLWGVAAILTLVERLLWGRSGSTTGSEPMWLVIVSGIIGALASFLTASIVLFNRPRWAVPPPLRTAKGLIREQAEQFGSGHR